MPTGCATVIAAWILHLQGHGAPIKDPAADAAGAAAANPDFTSAVSGVLNTLDPELSADAELVDTIKSRIHLLIDSP
jgi:fructuronate reductase